MHRIVSYKPDGKSGTCSECGPVRLYRQSASTFICHNQARGRANKWARENFKDNPYRRFLKETCERCDFEPEHICQLDVHHLDGNRRNNDKDNLQTLCANCHRYVEHKLRYISK